MRKPLRLLVVADEEPPLSAGELIAANSPEAVVTLGDLPEHWTYGLRDAEIPCFGVHGNHDAFDQLADARIEDIHLRTYELHGWSFCGFEGAPRYREGNYQYSQDEAGDLVGDLPAADVLVTHCPPAGINDEPDDPVHSGFDALRGWIDEHPPLQILHGHTTPDPRTRVGHFGTTAVRWVRGATVVELDANQAADSSRA